MTDLQRFGTSCTVRRQIALGMDFEESGMSASSIYKDVSPFVSIPLVPQNQRPGLCVLQCAVCAHGVGRITDGARLAQVDEDKEAERTKAYAQTLWDTALLESGFEIEAPKEFNARIYDLLAQAYSIQGELGLSEDEVQAAAAEEVRP